MRFTVWLEGVGGGVLGLLALVLVVFASFLIVVAKGERCRARGIIDRFGLDDRFRPFDLPSRRGISRDHYEGHLRILGRISSRAKVGCLGHQLFSTDPVGKRQLSCDESVGEIAFTIRAMHEAELVRGFRVGPSLVRRKEAFGVPSLRKCSSGMVPIRSVVGNSGYHRKAFFVRASSRGRVSRFVSLLGSELGRDRRRSFEGSSFGIGPRFVSRLSPSSKSGPKRVVIASLLFVVVFLVALVLSSSQRLTIRHVGNLSVQDSFLILLKGK